MNIQKFTAADGALAAALYNKYAEVEFVHKKLAEVLQALCLSDLIP